MPATHNIRTSLALILGLILGIRLMAAEPAEQKPLAVASSGPRLVAVGLVIPADCALVTIHSPSDGKWSSGGGDEGRDSLDAVARKAAETGRYRVLRGALASGQWNDQTLLHQFGRIRSDLALLVPLKGESEDGVTARAEVIQWIDSLRLPPRSRCEVGSVRLAVEDPERYRSQLLRAIGKDLRKARTDLASLGAAQVEGLEGPVEVRSVDDRRVEAFVKYRLTVTVGAEP